MEQLLLILMIDSQKVVVPAKAGIQAGHNFLKIQNPDFRRNDKIKHSSTFFSADGNNEA